MAFVRGLLFTKIMKFIEAWGSFLLEIKKKPAFVERGFLKIIF